MVRRAIAGASVLQIAAVIGHTLKDVEAILDAHYLGRDIQLAEAAALKLEARTKLQTVAFQPLTETAKRLKDLVGAPGLEPGTR